MVEARRAVETAVVARVQDLEPLSSIMRTVERLVVEGRMGWEWHPVEDVVG